MILSVKFIMALLFITVATIVQTSVVIQTPLPMRADDTECEIHHGIAAALQLAVARLLAFAANACSTCSHTAPADTRLAAVTNIP